MKDKEYILLATDEDSDELEPINSANFIQPQTNVQQINTINTLSELINSVKTRTELWHHRSLLTGIATGCFWGILTGAIVGLTIISSGTIVAGALSGSFISGGTIGSTLGGIVSQYTDNYTYIYSLDEAVKDAVKNNISFFEEVQNTIESGNNMGDSVIIVLRKLHYRIY